MAKKSETFSVGTKVKWASQAAGSRIVKVGVVVEVVPALREPNTRLEGAGWPRNHESYVVTAQPVEHRSGMKSPTLGRNKTYWPVASLLRRWTGDEFNFRSMRVGK